MCLSAGVGGRLLRGGSLHRDLKDEARYDGAVQKLNNVLHLHGPKLLRERALRDGAFDALALVAAKLRLLRGCPPAARQETAVAAWRRRLHYSATTLLSAHDLHPLFTCAVHSYLFVYLCFLNV